MYRVADSSFGETPTPKLKNRIRFQVLLCSVYSRHPPKVLHPPKRLGHNKLTFFQCCPPIHAQFRNLQWHQSQTLYCHATAVCTQNSPQNRKNSPHNAPKVAIWRPKIEKKFWGGGTVPSPYPSPSGEGTPVPTPYTPRRLRRLNSARAFGALPPQTLSLPPNYSGE